MQQRTARGRHKYASSVTSVFVGSPPCTYTPPTTHAHPGQCKASLVVGLGQKGNAKHYLRSFDKGLHCACCTRRAPPAAAARRVGGLLQQCCTPTPTPTSTPTSTSAAVLNDSTSLWRCKGPATDKAVPFCKEAKEGRRKMSCSSAHDNMCGVNASNAIHTQFVHNALLKTEKKV